MNNKSLLKLLCILLFLIADNSYAQQKDPYTPEIQVFKKQDSISFPPKNAILLIGSSSFTRWKDVQSYFPGYKIINRGFGGSTLPDVIKHFNDVVMPYSPKQILIYCGENDLASSDAITVPIVVARFKELYGMIRKGLGNNVNVTYVSMKPSPSRRRLMPKYTEANALIKAYLAKEKNTGFIDVYKPMLASDGQPIKDIFVADSLHMKANGYAIWQKVIQPYLLK
ncbi:MAG TPA: G-D-S-L family lipolytic protein [Sphingobacteriaceae bacterium]|nr:G-D-S-L family lipolytic protein [Sphingobacteriaceae bacterium]